MSEAVHQALERCYSSFLRWGASCGRAATAVPQSLAQLEGNAMGHPVVMETRRFSGRGYAAITVAAIRDRNDRILTATLVGLPDGRSGMPIVGADLIGLRGSLSLVAMDLAPTDPSLWDRVARPILEDLRRRTAELVQRKRPEFTADTFSRLAVVAGARRGQETVVTEAVVAFVEALARCEQTVGERAEHRPEVHRRVRKWCASELGNRKEHDALARIFGADVAERYLGQFLFDVEERA